MKSKIVSEKTINSIFRAKESFHQKMAKLPIEQKIEMLVRLQELASNIHPHSRKKRWIWKIS